MMTFRQYILKTIEKIEQLLENRRKVEVQSVPLQLPAPPVKRTAHDVITEAIDYEFEERSQGRIPTEYIIDLEDYRLLQMDLSLCHIADPTTSIGCMLCGMRLRVYDLKGNCIL